MRMMDRDCSFLSRYNLMDYSLIVGLKVLSVHEAKAKAFNPGQLTLGGAPQDQPSVSIYGGQVVCLHVGIIDFLQDWNFGKKAARKVKFLEFNKATVPPVQYGPRFAKYVVVVVCVCERGLYADSIGVRGAPPPRLLK